MWEFDAVFSADEKGAWSRLGAPLTRLSRAWGTPFWSIGRRTVSPVVTFDGCDFRSRRCAVFSAASVSGRSHLLTSRWGIAGGHSHEHAIVWTLSPGGAGVCDTFASLRCGGVAVTVVCFSLAPNSCVKRPMSASLWSLTTSRASTCSSRLRRHSSWRRRREARNWFPNSDNPSFLSVDRSTQVMKPSLSSRSMPWNFSIEGYK